VNGTTASGMKWVEWSKRKITIMCEDVWDKDEIYGKRSV